MDFQLVCLLEGMVKLSEDRFDDSRVLLRKVADYFERKIGMRSTGEKLVGGPDRVLISFHERSRTNNSYSIEVTAEEPNNVALVFYEEVEISSVSLADPRLAYQNTSARRVKLSKRRLNKTLSSYEEATRVIDKWFNQRVT